MEISLLLVGRDGNGKSSTGNSILGGKHFTPTSSTSSVGVDIQQASATVGSRVVTVTEIAGLEYPGTDNAGDIEGTLRKIEETITKNEKGFNAVIIVLKYGVRFTKQEKDALLIIRSIFGSNVFKEFGVVVMTNGDCFDFDVEDDKRTFEEWCRNQTGDVRTLFDDCKSRCVLFNNRTKDEKQMEDQRQNLFSAVTNISHLYTLDEYKKAVMGQTEILVQSKLPEIEKHKNDVMSEVWTELDKTDKKYPAASLDLLELACLLNNIEEKLQGLTEFMIEKDNKTGVLKHLFYDIPVAEMRIHTKRQIFEQKLHILAPLLLTVVICFLEDLEKDSQDITDTITIQECLIDKDGRVCGKSVSGQDVSRYCMALIEICKTTPSSQQDSPPNDKGQVAKNKGQDSQLTDDQQVTKNKGQDSQLTDDQQVTKNKGQDSQLTDDQQVTKNKGQDSQLTDDQQVTKNKGQDSQLTDDQQVTKNKGQDSQLTDDQQVTKNKGQDSQLTDDQQVTKNKGQDSQLTDDQQVTKNKGQDSQLTDDQQVTKNKGQDSQLTDDQQVTKNKGQDSQLTDDQQVTKNKGQDSQLTDDQQVTKAKDFEITKRLKEIMSSLKHNNLTRAICLISKYEQKLTKEETDVVIEKAEKTYGTSEIKHHSILILTCDNDNLEAVKAQMLEVWLKEETGTNQRLLNACGKRYLLLNTKTKNRGTLRDGGLAPSTQPVAGSGPGNASKKAEVDPMVTESASKPNTAPENSWYSAALRNLFHWNSK